jgi:hypothetical protein
MCRLVHSFGQLPSAFFLLWENVYPQQPPACARQYNVRFARHHD